MSARIEAEGPVALFTRHAVVPAAIIAMVSAFLFYLLEVRSVFFGGSGAFKQAGLCFSAATVLIARYGRGNGRGDGHEISGPQAGYQGFYTTALVIATLLFMLQASGPAAFLPNALILAAVWRFATGVTRELSLERELEEPRPPELWIYGLERLRFEEFLRRRREETEAARGTGAQIARRDPDAHGNPVGAVARLAALALLGFAVGEPFLLRAAPDVAQRALADVAVFLFSTALVLAAGSSAGTLRHALRSGGRVSPGVLPARVGMAAVLSVAVLAAAMAIPGVRFQGQGKLRTASAPGKTGTGDDQGDGRSDARSRRQGEGAQGGGLGDGIVPGGSVPGGETGAGGGQGRVSGHPGGEAGSPAAALVGLLGSLGKWLRIPVVLGVLFLALYALRALGPLLPRLRSLLERLRAWLLPLLTEAVATEPPARTDPFADLGELAALPPRDAVLAAYQRLLAALEQAGHPRPERATPYEHLGALPVRLRGEGGPVGRLTDLYVLAAYGDGEPAQGDREGALAALGELEGLLASRGGPGGGPPRLRERGGVAPRRRG